MCKHTTKLLQQRQRNKITLKAVHLLGADKLADTLSRKTSGIQDSPRPRGSSVEWNLYPIVCKTVNRLQRTLIDLFESRELFRFGGT